ncbi:hypothetical protein CIT25_00195 [Mesorhizobium mediterraneum]|uniref:Uncharacterized protein n=1 Tax=Mesorhizobium mediterraneum TaxID=43617 RepID=A0AB36RIV7_9HYPH|nr:hypothetical protein CIT25_00195 [Mesorhizobium mediterraneum]
MTRSRVTALRLILDNAGLTKPPSAGLALPCQSGEDRESGGQAEKRKGDHQPEGPVLQAEGRSTESPFHAYHGCGARLAYDRDSPKASPIKGVGRFDDLDPRR